LNSCTEKTIIASSAIFGGLTFLFPSLITLYTYLTKWIPEATPQEQARMKLVLIGSGLAGVIVISAGVYYLKKEKCI